MSEKVITAEFLESLTKAITSASQANNHSLVHQINVQSYSGSDRDGVYSFIEKFEDNTSQLDDAQKLSIIQRFLIDDAKTWFKLNIKPTLETSSWETVKKALLSRFGGQDKEGFHLDKIRGMKFNQESGTLSNFVEKFYFHYDKAYPHTKNENLVREIHRSLPKELQADINRFRQVSDIKDIKDYMKIIRDYDEQVLALVNKDKSVCAIQNNEEIAKIIAQSLKPMIAEMIMEKITDSTDHTVAAVVQRRPNHQPQSQQANNYQNSTRQPRGNYHQQVPAYQQRFQRQQQPFYQPRQMMPQQQVPETTYNQQANGQQIQQQQRQPLLQQPNQEYGQTQAPRVFDGCFNCKGNHYARDCPVYPQQPRVLKCYNCQGNHYARDCNLNVQGRTL